VKHPLAVPSSVPTDAPIVESPIIIIGCGRSGSSLLDRCLSAHPDILMLAELDFTVPRAWEAYSEIFASARAWNLYAKYEQHKPTIQNSVHTQGEQSALLTRLDNEEWERRGATLRRTIADLYCLYERRTKFWGFKEIWNGSLAHCYDWAIYDAVFPRAHWIHIIRNPAEYLRAVAWHARKSFSETESVDVLRDWARVFAMSRLRADTGRYHEIQYEKLIRSPQDVLNPLFDRLQLPWDQNCSGVLKNQVGVRSGGVALPPFNSALIERVAGLSEILREFGYSCDYDWGDTASESLTSQPPRLVRLGEERWQLKGDFRREEGACWIFNLSATDQGVALAGSADKIDFWMRSPLRLFEGDRLLGPSHSLHNHIRNTGRGAYSHWRDDLMFSTSDNTDPNGNGRMYSFDLGG
jgi:hypothetical protein